MGDHALRLPYEAATRSDKHISDIPAMSLVGTKLPTWAVVATVAIGVTRT
jgi:hypothetical protein